MREWFKYENGFVNIDDDNLYLTNTGNWSETPKTKEKSSSSKKSNFWRKLKINSFFYLVAAVFIALYLLKVISGDWSLGILGTLAVVGYFFYNYLRTEMGSKYKIPRSKIKEIQIREKTVLFVFFNEQGNEDVEKLNNVEEKGRELLEELFLSTSESHKQE